MEPQAQNTLGTIIRFSPDRTQKNQSKVRLSVRFCDEVSFTITPQKIPLFLKDIGFLDEAGLELALNSRYKQQAAWDTPKI